MKRYPKLTPAEQRIRFNETARELGITNTEAAPESAHGKLGNAQAKEAQAQEVEL